MSYPKWLYHPKCEALMVVSEAQEKAIGSGWYESPAYFPVEERKFSEPAMQVADAVVSVEAPKRRGRPAKSIEEKSA